MNKLRGKIVLVSIMAFVLITSAVYLFFDHIMIYFLSRASSLSISYSDFKAASLNEFIFNDLTIINKKIGFGLFSQSADIKPIWRRASSGNMMINFNLQDVNFLKDESTQGLANHDNLYRIVSIPFDSNWTYKTIVGKIEPFGERINITDCIATSDDIKLSLNGTIFYDQTLDMNAVIYLSDKVTGTIPKELSVVILQNEPGGWKSLSVKIEGDYRSPSIQLSSKLFRMNIKTVYEAGKTPQD